MGDVGAAHEVGSSSKQNHGLTLDLPMFEHPPFEYPSCPDFSVFSQPTHLSHSSVPIFLFSQPQPLTKCSRGCVLIPGMMPISLEDRVKQQSASLVQPSACAALLQSETLLYANTVSRDRMVENEWDFLIRLEEYQLAKGLLRVIRGGCAAKTKTTSGVKSKHARSLRRAAASTLHPHEPDLGRRSTKH